MRVRPPIALFVLSLVLALAPAVFAQPATPPPVPEAFFRQDVDHDGVITRAEWRGRPAEFSRLDADQDGVLSVKDGLPLRVPLPVDVGLEKDIRYKRAGGAGLAMDKYSKRGASYRAAPALVYIHGGYFLWGDKEDLLADAWLPVVLRLLEEGYICFSVNYRLAGEPAAGTTVVDCVSDCRDAVRYLRKNADSLGIDAGRLAVWGTSAGGHLALMTLAADDPRPGGDPDLAAVAVEVSCAVDWFGPTDWLTLAYQAALGKGSAFGSDTQKKMFGATEADDPDRYALLSPIVYLSGAAAPILVCHGDRDTTVPVDQSRRFARHARAAGAAVEYLEVKNAAHRFVPSDGAMSPGIDEINRLTVEFILKNNVRR